MLILPRILLPEHRNIFPFLCSAGLLLPTRPCRNYAAINKFNFLAHCSKVISKRSWQEAAPTWFFDAFAPFFVPQINDWRWSHRRNRSNPTSCCTSWRQVRSGQCCQNCVPMQTLHLQHKKLQTFHVRGRGCGRGRGRRRR